MYAERFVIYSRLSMNTATDGSVVSTPRAVSS